MGEKRGIATIRFKKRIMTFIQRKLKPTKCRFMTKSYAPGIHVRQPYNSAVELGPVWWMADGVKREGKRQWDEPITILGLGIWRWMFLARTYWGMLLAAMTVNENGMVWNWKDERRVFSFSRETNLARFLGAPDHSYRFINAKCISFISV